MTNLLKLITAWKISPMLNSSLISLDLSSSARFTTNWELLCKVRKTETFSLLPINQFKRKHFIIKMIKKSIKLLWSEIFHWLVWSLHLPNYRSFTRLTQWSRSNRRPFKRYTTNAFYIVLTTTSKYIVGSLIALDRIWTFYELKSFIKCCITSCKNIFKVYFGTKNLMRPKIRI